MHHSPRPRFLVTAAALVLLATGCGAAAEKVSEKAAEQAIESQTGGDVDIDTSGDGEVTIETDEGTFSAGSTEVPEEWPDDVPLPDDLTIISSSTSDGTDGRIVFISGSTSASTTEVLEQVKEALADWTISGESTMDSSGGSLTGAQWDTEGRRVTLAAASGDDPTSTVTITHTTLE